LQRCILSIVGVAVAVAVALPPIDPRLIANQTQVSTLNEVSSGEK